ncbi:MAG: serine/threonine protein kinase [Acidobacteriota bacterium]
MLQRTNSPLVPLSELAEEPYSSVLGYPAARTKKELEERVGELEGIGVKGIIFEGRSKIGRLGVLGKGYVGIVVKALLADSSYVALKIRRTDASRESMEREACLLKIANSVGVGPRLLASSRNFLAMDFATGTRFIDWIKPERDAEEVRTVILEVLEQCFRLDATGLDHGELSNLRKHVIVGEHVTIIDFESSSTGRRTSNVTAASQFLFIGSPIAPKVRKVLGTGPADEVIRFLAEYKNDHNRESFESLLRVLKLRE